MLDKISMVHSDEYLEHKQNLLDQMALETGEKPLKARIETFEFLQIMTEAELNVTLLAMLPFIRIEEKPAPDKCKYMIGTQSGLLLIKSNQIMIRVGGGYATLHAHIRQVGSFECIKIYKTMKNGDDKKVATSDTMAMSFREAVVYFMKRLKVSDRIVQKYSAADDDE